MSDWRASWQGYTQLFSLWQPPYFRTHLPNSNRHPRYRCWICWKPTCCWKDLEVASYRSSKKLICFSPQCLTHLHIRIWASIWLTFQPHFLSSFLFWCPYKWFIHSLLQLFSSSLRHCCFLKVPLASHRSFLSFAHYSMISCCRLFPFHSRISQSCFLASSSIIHFLSYICPATSYYSFPSSCSLPSIFRFPSSSFRFLPFPSANFETRLHFWPVFP